MAHFHKRIRCGSFGIPLGLPTAASELLSPTNKSVDTSKNTRTFFILRDLIQECGPIEHLAIIRDGLYNGFIN